MRKEELLKLIENLDIDDIKVGDILKLFGKGFHSIKMEPEETYLGLAITESRPSEEMLDRYDMDYTDKDVTVDYIIHCSCGRALKIKVDTTYWFSHKTKCSCGRCYKFDVITKRDFKVYGVHEEITEEEFNNLDEDLYFPYTCN